MANLVLTVSPDNQEYQENPVLQASRDRRDHLAIEDNQDPQVCQEWGNREKMASEANQVSREVKGNQGLPDYQGVPACQVTVNRGFLDQRVTKDMPVSPDLQA